MKLLRDTAIALLIISVFPTVSLSIVTAPLQTLWEAIKIRSDVANFTPSLVFLRIDDGAFLGNRKLPAPGSEVCGLDPLGPVDDGGAVPPEGDGLPEQPAGIDEEGSFDVAPLDCGGYPNFDDPSSIPCDL